MQPKPLTIAEIILLIVVLGAGAWWLAKQPAGVAPRSPSPSISNADTTGWQTYRNEEYGFEINYPKSWAIREINSSPTKQIILDSDIQSTMAIHYVATLPEYLNQNGYYRNNGLTLKEYLDEEAQQRNIDDIQAYDLSGTLAYSYEALAHKYLELSTKPAQFGVIAVHNGSVYEILFSHAPTAEEKQILRSFRFTN